jgi:hypothetical protein
MYDIIKLMINLNPPRKNSTDFPFPVDKLEIPSFVGI